MVRTGAASPDLIKLIIAHFEDLDVDKDGGLTMDEICQRVSNKRRKSEHVDQTLRQAVRRASLTLTDVAIDMGGGGGLDEQSEIRGLTTASKPTGNIETAGTLSPFSSSEGGPKEDIHEL